MESNGIMAALDREVRKYIVLPRGSMLDVREINVSGGRISATVFFVIDEGHVEIKKDIPAINIDAVHTKRKYTRRKGQSALTVKTPRKEAGACEDDLKMMKKNLRNWDAGGHLDENQVAAWTSLSHTNIHVMTDIQKEQLRDIYTSVRGKVGKKNG